MRTNKLEATASAKPARNAVRAAAVAAIAAALAGCYPYQTREGLSEPVVSNDYRQRHPIAIVEGERTMTVFVGSQRGSLMPAQRAEILAFSQSWRREATGAVVLDVPANAPNERMAMEAVKEIQSLLRASDIPPAAIRIRRYQSPEANRLASIRINYTRIAADTDKCGMWPRDLGPDTDPKWQENRPYHNLGCSTQHNLAAMVDNPADLVQPRVDSPAYSPRRSTVLEKYRKGESPATNYPNANQGRIADVGQ